MVKYLSYIDIHFKNIIDGVFEDYLKNEFEKEASILALFYNFKMNKILTPGIGKINFYFTTNRVFENKFQSDSISNYWIYVDVSNKFESKCLALLELLNSAFIDICKKNSFNYEPFGEIYNYILSKNFSFKEKFSKSIWNFSKTYCVELLLVVEKGLDIYVQIKNKEGVLESILINRCGAVIVTIKDYITFYYKKIKWVDDNVLRIIHSNNKDFFEISVDGTIYFHFDRAEKGDAHGQYDLAMMYLNGEGVLKDLEKAKHWLKKSADQNYQRALVQLKKMNS